MMSLIMVGVVWVGKGISAFLHVWIEYLSFFCSILFLEVCYVYLFYFTFFV